MRLHLKGAKMNDNVTKSCAVHFVSICYVILFLFYGFFPRFQHFKVFFLLVFDSDCIGQEREFNPNADYSDIFLARLKQITSLQSICIQDDLFFRSFTIACWLF